MAARQRIHFVSLGCAKNRVDTEVMLGVAERSGHDHVEDPASADVIVVNTCGFIGPAKEESIETVLEMAELKQTGACRRLVVAGCLPQRYADELSEAMPEVDHFLGSSDMLALERVLGGQGERVLVGHPAQWVLRASDPRRLSGPRHSAYVKIAEGCNRRCSFCAIPGIRGKQRSRPPDDVVREVERLAAEGTVEVNLVSQDTIAYGRDLDGRPTLADLVARLAEVPGIRWVRLHYLYPESLTDALVDLVAHHPRVLPYVDMPLQHASDAMLRRMRRGHGGARIYRVVDTVRERIPNAVFRTTFIVGHPGETDADFEALMALVRHARFDHVGVFQYSHEEGTHAGDMTDLVPDEVVQARHAALMDAQRPISRGKLEGLVGAELDVLVDGVSDESDLLLEGRWWGQAPEVDGKVHLANGTAEPGEIRRALVTQAGDYDLLADLLAPDGSHDAPADAPRPRRRTVHLPTVA
jgi:ribosomal protein S12 methylthiotransferase